MERPVLKQWSAGVHRFLMAGGKPGALPWPRGKPEQQYSDPKNHQYHLEGESEVYDTVHGAQRSQVYDTVAIFGKGDHAIGNS